MKALLLGAGYATRLYPLTRERPKPLLPVGGVAILERICGKIFPVPGVDRIYIVTNHRFAGHYYRWLSGFQEAKEPPVPIEIFDDLTNSPDDRLGAIGDIGFVLDEQQLDDDLVVVAGDNLFGSDVSEFAAYGREVDAPVIALHDVGDLSRMPEYNQIEVDSEGRIVFFEEKPASARTTLAGVALYYYPRRALPLVRQYLAEGNNPDQPGRLVEWLYPRTAFYTWLLPGEWYDIGSAETLQEADRIFSQSRND